MSQPVVVFEHVWKKFRRGERHDSLRDLVPAVVKRLISQQPKVELEEAEFWALKDVSFAVKRGEALGIIGSNGAGKSTTLKLLTRILKATRGQCSVKGRVGALIEVAAGFHPDLTGRENVYLQGAIMGMGREAITRRFDDIVSFAGVSEFIDTPVKRYSSGMNARLGFSIAAHLEPEVLIVDEVLSVGDFAFQQIAFARMQEIAARDIAVVVVSHQLDRISALCTSAILLHKGALIKSGTPADCIAAYTAPDLLPKPRSDAPVSVERLSRSTKEPIPSGERLTVVLSGSVLRPMKHVSVGLGVRSAQSSEVLFSTGTDRHSLYLSSTGRFEIEFDLQMNVPEGHYLIETYLYDLENRKEFASGPRAHVEVTPTTTFRGVVQLNARLGIKWND